MKVDLIRHGETEWLAEGRYQGRTDVPLSEAGRRALESVCRMDCMDSGMVRRVYVSPLLRARETAAILFPDAEQISIPAFSEMDFGVFEGRSYKEMEHDADYRAWVGGGCTGRCPGGESREEFCMRVRDAFAALLDEAAKPEAAPDPDTPGGPPDCPAAGPDAPDGSMDSLVIVAHGGTIMAALSAFGRPVRDYFDWHCGCGCGFRLDAGKWKDSRTLMLDSELSFIGGGS